MARNIATYISNLGRSVSYSAVDKVNKMAPALGSFSETNAELFKDVYKNIRNYKVSYKKTGSVIKSSKLYEVAEQYKKSLFEDIKSGKFYNKERESELATKALDLDFNMDFDISVDDNTTLSSMSNKPEDTISRYIIDSERSNSEAISMSVAKTGQYITEGNKASTNLLYTQNVQYYTMFNKNLNAINQNVSNLLQFSTSVIQTNVENSKIYFEKTTHLLEEQTKLLTELVNIAKPSKKKEKKSEKQLTFSDMVDSENMPNLRDYMKNIKRNFKNETSMFDMFSGLGGENSNPLLMFASSPLKFITDGIVNKMVPNAIENSLKSFDKSFSNFFGSLMAKFNGMSDNDDNLMASMFGKVFGVRNKAKTSIDTSNYNKDKVNWNGKSQKALIEVIPTQLSKIISLLSGKSEKIYDYEKGSFIDGNDIKKQYENEVNYFQKNATNDMKDEFEKYLKLMTFNSIEERKDLMKDIDNFFKSMYKSGKLFDINSKDTDYDYYNVNDPKNFKLIRQMFTNTPRHLQHSINTNILTERDRQTKHMDYLEKEGSIYNQLFNGSDINEFNKETKNNQTKSLLSSNNIKNILDDKGHNIFYYIQNIYKELSFIRQMGINGGDINNSVKISGSNGEMYRNKINDIDDIQIPDKTYSNYDYNDRENEYYLKYEKNRMKKNKRIVNMSQIYDEDKAALRLQSAIDIDKNYKQFEREEPKEPTLIDRLLSAKSISAKSQEVIKTLDNMSKKPIEFFTNVLDKVDKRMYDIIYGNPNNEDKGFMDAMISNIKNTFSRLNNWLDDEILNPIKNKLKIEKFSDLGDKFLGLFGTDTKTLKNQIHDFFWDDDKGIFSSTKKATKRIFKGALDIVKDSMKSVYGPIFNKLKPKNKYDEISFDDLDNEEELKNIKKIKHKNKGKNHNIQYTDLTNSETRIKGYKEYIKNMSYNDQSDYLSKQMAKYEISNKGKVGKKIDQINNSKNEIYNLEPSLKNNSLTKKQYKEIQRLIRLKKKGYNLEKSGLDMYYDQGKTYLTSGLGEMFNLDDGQKSEINEALQMSLLRDVFNNKDNANKTVGSLDINSLIHSLSLKSGNISKSLQNKLSKYNQNIYGNVNPSLISLVDNKLQSPLNKNKDVNELVENYPNLVGKNSNDQSNKLYDIINTIKNKITSIYDILKEARQQSIPKESKFILNPGLKTEEGKAVGDMAQGLSNIISNWLYGNMPHYNNGTETPIDKAHVATVGKGEVVLSKDNVDKVTTIIGDLIESLRLGNEKTSKLAKNVFAPIHKSLNGDVNKAFEITENNSIIKDKLNNLSDDDKKKYNKVKNTMLSKSESLKDDIKETLDNKINPFISDIGHELKNGATLTSKALFGNNPKGESRKFGNVVSDVSKNITKYAPDAIGTGLLGGGISLLTGAIGGPLLGASVGAGVSLVKNSNAAQEWLFGKMVDGEHEGGIIGKNTLRTMKKYLPDLKKYGIAGGVTGLIPFLPFGPAGGLIMGSTFAMAKNNDKIQKALFGDTGLISEESKEKVKKMMPKAAAGALVGAITGPFGLLGNTLIGSATGLATGTQTFQKIMLGTYNPKTKQYENGMLSEFREALINPLRKNMDGLKDKIADFLKNDIFKPLKEFMVPFKQEVKHVGKNIGRWFGKKLDQITEGIFGVPLHKIIQDKIVKPISNFALGFMKKGTNLAKNVVSAPFKLLGKAGKHLTKKQIKKGYAANMSAEDRMQFRKNNKMGSNDKYRKVDILMKDLTQEGLNELNEQVDTVTKSEMKSKRRDIIKEMGSVVSNHYDSSKSKDIMKNLVNNNYQTAIEKMKLNKLSGKSPEILKNIKSYGSSYSNIKSSEDNSKNNIISIINKQFSNDEETRKKIIKLLHADDRSGISQTLKEKIPKSEYDKLYGNISENYFDLKDKNKIKSNELDETLKNRLGLYVGEESRDKILKRIKNGDTKLAEQMLGIHIQGSKNNKLSNQVKDEYKEYNKYTDTENELYSNIDTILNQTYDKNQKNELFDLINRNDIQSFKKYISRLGKGKSNKLLEQLNPHLQNLSNIGETRYNSIEKLEKVLGKSDLPKNEIKNILSNTKKGNYNKTMSSLHSDKSAATQTDLLEYIHDRYKDFDKVNVNNENIKNVKENLYNNLSKKFGVDINSDNIYKIKDYIKTEMTHKDKHESLLKDDKDQVVKVQEETIDMNETHHKEVMSLFEKTVKLLENISNKNITRTTAELKNNKVNNKIKQHKEINNALKKEKEASDNVAQTISENLYANTTHYADGGFSKKAQLATIGEGEVIFSKENTNKLLDVMKTSLNVVKKKDKENDKRDIVRDAKGNVVEYIKNSRGEWTPDLADASTKKVIDSAKKEEKQNDTLLSKIGNLFGKKKKDDDDNKDKKKKDKKSSLLEKILGIISSGKGLFGKLLGGGLSSLLGKGLFGKALGIGAGIIALPKIIEFTKKVAIPVMSDVYQNSFKPWLKDSAVPWLKETGVPLFAEGIKTGVRELPGLIAGALKFTFTDLIPTLANSIGEVIGLSGKDGEESVQGRVGKGLTRHILTGGATSRSGLRNAGKKTTEKLAEKGLFGKIEYSLKHPFKVTSAGIGRLTNKGLDKATDITKKGHTKLSDYIKQKIHPTDVVKENENIATKMYKRSHKPSDKTTKQSARYMRNRGAKEATEKTTKNIVEKNGFNKVTGYLSQKLKSKATKEVNKKGLNDSTKPLTEAFLKNIKEFLEKLLTNPVVIKVLGSESIEKLSKSFVPKIVKEVGENIAKKGAEITGKMLAATTPMGLILNATFAAGDFVSGFRDAKNILSITNEPSFGMKVASGFVKGLNGLFLVTSFIPEKVWVDIIVNIIMPLFGAEDKEFLEMRKKAAKEVASYNKKNKTNYNVEQYNKNVLDKNKPTLWNKFKNSSFIQTPINITKKLGEKINNSRAWKGFKNLDNWVGQKGKQAGNWVKNNAQYVGNQYNKLDNWVGEKGKQAGSWISNKAKQTGSWVGEKGKQAGSWISNKWQSLFGNGEGNAAIGGGFGFGQDEQPPENMGGFGKIETGQKPKNVIPFKGGFGKGKKTIQFPITDKPLNDNSFGASSSSNESKAGSTSELTVKNGMVHYAQGDPKWGQTQYGTGTIGSSGCGPTSAAMVLSSLTGKAITPVETSAYSVAHGHRVPNVGTSWGFFKDIGQKYGIDFNQTNDQSTIVNALSNKQPVIFSGQGSVPFTKGGHFVVGAGMNGENIAINDPVSLERSKDYSKNTIFSQMLAAFVSNKALDGKLVDSTGNNSSGEEQQEEKPSVFSLFDDLSKTVMSSVNTMYGFDSILGNTSSNGANSETSNGLASQQIINYIKSKEGFKANKYLDSGGTPTIGYGSTHGWIMNKSTVTEAEATKALSEESNKVASEIKSDLDKKGIKLKQHEFDALCSFGYNLGTNALFNSQLYKQIISGQRGQPISDQFMRFVHCGSSILPGLVARRKEEAAIFASGSASGYTAGGGFGFGDNLSKFGIGGGFGNGEITTEDLQKFFPKGRLKDNADYIIRISNKYGVDPALVSAIMMMETGGSSYALNTQNNPMGISGNGGPRTFGSLQEGIDYSIRNLKTTYFDKGLNTIEKIGNVYCPVGAANDPNDTNGEWIPGVKKYYKQLTKKDNLDGTVTGKSTEGGKEEKPSLINLFTDMAKTTVNGLNTTYGFDTLSEPTEQNNSQDNIQQQTTGGFGYGDKRSENPADRWFGKSLNANITSNIDPNRIVNGIDSPHYGIDYGTDEGKTIKSPVSGIVYTNKSADSGSGYGNHVVIKDDKGNFHYFGHMKDQSKLNIGDKISIGQDLGSIGDTGNATGPHLHYEVRSNNGTTKLNPNSYLNSYYTNKSTAETAVGGENININSKKSYIGESLNNPTAKKLLTAIINVLVKISDNTSILSQIVNILSNNFKSKGDIETVKKLNNIKQNGGGMQQVINLTKEQSDKYGDVGNEYLLDILQTLASE